MIRTYVLDIENCQEAYASALDFIKAIEDEKSGTSEERKKILLEMSGRISVHVGWMRNNTSARYLEQLISLSDRGKGLDEGIQDRHEFREDDIVVLRQEGMNIRYHIRVHFRKNGQTRALEERELIHLQYLAMFLKKVSLYFSRKENIGNRELLSDGIAGEDGNHSDEKKLKKHLTVFIAPVTGNEYPFKDRTGEFDCATYAYVSRYLRLLSKKYTGVIYGR